MKKFTIWMIVLFSVITIIITYVWASSSAKTNISVPVASGSGTAWTGLTTEGNGDVDNQTYASVSLGVTATSKLATCKGFNFAVPAGCTINGVQVVLNGYENITDGSVYLGSIRLLDAAGTVTGDDSGGTAKAFTSVADNNITCGNTSAMWGCALTDTWVNDVDFGVGIKFSNFSDTYTYIGYLDCITITVTYTEAVSGGHKQVIGMSLMK